MSHIVDWLIIESFEIGTKDLMSLLIIEKKEEKEIHKTESKD